MPDPLEEPFPLELAACQLQLASARLHLNTLQMQHLALAQAVQSTLHLLTRTGMLEPFPAHQDMIKSLSALAALQIEQVRRECAVPDMPLPDPYDLRALKVDPNTASRSETPFEDEG